MNAVGGVGYGVTTRCGGDRGFGFMTVLMLLEGSSVCAGSLPGTIRWVSVGLSPLHFGFLGMAATIRTERRRRDALVSEYFLLEGEAAGNI